MTKSFSDYLDWISENTALFGSDKKAHAPAPLHPGVFLKQEFIEKRKGNQSKLAKMLGCTHAKINEIVNGKRSITPNFALKLEEVLGISAETWVSLQSNYDLNMARQKKRKANVK